MPGASRRHQLASLLLCVLATCSCVCGCQTAPPHPPRPLPQVNAALPDDLPIYFDRQAAGDTRVVARCKELDEFWQKRVRGWEYVWLVAKFDVLEVERGTWQEPTLSFLTWYAYPTDPNTFIDPPIWPYREDVILAFELDTSCQPPRIIGQELRHDPHMAPAVP